MTMNLTKRLTMIPLALLFTALANPVLAELDPEWVVRLPVGTSLSAGMSGIVVDSAGVSYVTAITGSSSNTDILTAAFATDGTLLWMRTFNGPQDWHDQSHAITLGPAGNVLVVGNTPGPGMYAQVLLLEYEAATGNLSNSFQFSSAAFTSEYGGCLTTDAQGNIYIGGGTVGDGADGLILKFDAGGTLQWCRTWDGSAWGPYSQDQILQLEVDPAGDLVALIHGVMSSLHPDYVVEKYDTANGSTLWQSTWGVSGGDFARDMEIDAGGDIYVTGTGIDGIDKFSTIKLRGSDGILLWQAYDANGLDNSARALALDGLGGVYVTGSADPDGDLSNFNDNFYTVKRNASDGALLWTHAYGANCVGCFDVPSDVIVDVNGNVFLAGSTSSPPYAADVITFVLDANTGAEVERGVVSGAAGEHAGSGTLRFDGSFNLYNGGGLKNYTTGDVDISVFKYSRLGDGPTSYCATTANSSGQSALISFSGSLLLANDNVTLSATSLPAHQFGYFLMSRTQGFAPQFGGSQGILCLGAPIIRFAGNVLNSGASGQFMLALDLANLPQGTVFAPGERWNFQAWFRDQNPMNTSNTTNGMELPFQP
jgi:hypothetical protein